VYGLINNDEKVASSKQHYPIQDYGTVQNPYPIKTKLAKIDTLFMTKTAEKPYPLGPHILI